MVKSGEASGSLGDALESMSKKYEQDEKDLPEDPYRKHLSTGVDGGVTCRGVALGYLRVALDYIFVWQYVLALANPYTFGLRAFHHQLLVALSGCNWRTCGLVDQYV